MIEDIGQEMWTSMMVHLMPYSKSTEIYFEKQLKLVLVEGDTQQLLLTILLLPWGI